LPARGSTSDRNRSISSSAGHLNRELDTRREHVALRVRSYRQTVDHLRALGIPRVERPHNKTPWPQIYLADPDGNVIELNAEALD
jgi:glyoxylase I family protein